MAHLRTTQRRLGWVTGVLLVALLAFPATAADDKKPSYPKPPNAKDVKVIPDAWKSLPAKTLAGADVDLFLAKEPKAAGLTLAPVIGDEQFIRRATIDLTGKLPLPADINNFVSDKDPAKRSKLIDKLLDTEDYARHWARYWRDVVASHATEMRIRRATKGFEDWLTEQFKANKSWGDIATRMIAAKGDLRYDGKEQQGETFFMLCHSGPEADNERAAEVSRVFMGIQIQCAQCHDHPNDIWKREQFHEFAAFFSRTREQRIREENRLVGFSVTSLPRGEHLMPGRDNPRETTTMHPKFLTGEAPTRNATDLDRRASLAKYVTAKDNYWFSAAFVNRVWGELMGQSFYLPVDHMGPLQEATFPGVLLNVSSSFRTSNYDVKGLFRTIMNSQAYQRQMRIGERADQHLLFTASYPTRLSADVLWDSLNSALGGVQGGGPIMRPGAGPRGAFGGLAFIFRETFSFDPSTRADEVESSVPQALLLMNNPTLHERIKANGNTVLAGILKNHKSDDEAVQAVYLQTLARKPTARELETCLNFIKKVGNRGEAFEDILWSLVNSTEFQTKR